MGQVISFADWQKTLADISASEKSPSSQSSASVVHGPTLTDDEEIAIITRICIVLTRARLNPFTTKSDFARMAATEVALCASDGLITTRVNDGTVSNVWIITHEGIAALEELTDVLSS